MRISWPAEGDAILFEHRFQHLQARADRELEQLSARIDEQIDQRQVAGSFNSGGTWDCARLFHGGSCSVRLSPRVWLPLVYHEQRRSRRFNFQQLLGHPLQAVSFQQVGSDGCFEPAEHVGLAGPRVPPMKKLPLAGGAGATFSRARSLPPSGGRFFKTSAAYRARARRYTTGSGWWRSAPADR